MGRVKKEVLARQTTMGAWLVFPALMSRLAFYLAKTSAFSLDCISGNLPAFFAQEKRKEWLSCGYTFVLLA